MTPVARSALGRRLRSPAGIVLLYAVFSATWIAGSDRLLAFVFRDQEQFARVSTLKGMLFIAVTSTLLFLLLRAWHGSLSQALGESTHYRERLERVLKGTNDGWWDWELASGLVHYSPRFWEMLGYAPDTTVAGGEIWRELMHPDDLARAQRRFDEALAPGAQSREVEVRLRHRDGHYVPVLSRYMVQRDDAGRPLSVSGSNMDLTERKRAEVRLREAAAVFETTREGVMITDANQRIVMVNKAFMAITGYGEDEVVGELPRLLASGRHDPDFFSAMWSAIASGGYWQGEVWNRRKDGEIYPELLSISTLKDDAGAVVNYVGVFADLSRLKASESERDFLARHDPLTQLPNRVLLRTYLEHAIRSARRDGRQVALLMLDLDRFKNINDSFGHAAGDELLQQVARRIAPRLRGTDALARLGGDEFAVLLSSIAHAEDAAVVANELMTDLRRPWTLSNGAEVRVGASVGIGLYPDHGDSTEELLQHSDAALYQAKQEGRGCFRYFSQDLTRAARERIDLEARLHRALAQDELRVFYQPLIDIASGRIIGAEALVRWQDPVEGLIPPARFIPLAEATGLINSIGEWVLEQTCVQGRRWSAAGLPPLTLAVNISPRQFLHGDLAETVAATLARTGFPATCLELELTETALMEREQDAVQLLHRLRKIGVRMAIDDFGTGYSSLSHLKRLPFDVLKIDKHFIDDIRRGGNDGAIVAAIVAMGHSLGFNVLAEGVECGEQLAVLRTLGCDMYQGYLASRPLPAEEFERLVMQTPRVSAPP